MPSDPPTSLSVIQRRLLEQRLRERAAADSTPGTPSGIPRAPRDHSLPVSFGQERLWLLHHLEPGAATYHSAYLYRLSGPLNVAALASAMREIVCRHESLRTTFTVEDQVARQVIAEVEILPLPVDDVATVEEAREKARAAAAKPYDLTRDVRLRPHLFRLSAEEHVLLIAVHHSAWDASSTVVFWRELAELYAAAHDGRPATLPPLPVQYADFAAWQRARLTGATLERLLTFWRAQLADAPTLDLPADRPRPAELTYAGDVVEFTWPTEMRDGLSRLARAEGATLFMVLLAGWSTLLHRLSGQDTIITGTAVAGRAQRELEGLIGFFVNTLALRTDCSGQPTFRELLRRIHQTTLGAYDHDELPFEKLVAELRVPRDPARHPLFQTALVLHPAATSTSAPQLAGLEVTLLPRVLTAARFDLALTVTEHADGLHGALEFATDLFRRETMQRWMGHLETLLRGASDAPDQRIAQLPLLRDAERTTLLQHWSGATPPYPRDATVHGLFAERVEIDPHAPALVCGDNLLTYGELDARANRLARHLVAVTPRPGLAPECVAIELERSIDFVVTVLATLKIGAAYVPLLRDLPAPRRRLVFEDTRPGALICSGPPAGEVPADVRIVDLARDSGRIAGMADKPIPPRGAATDAAYVMYTSGSTGRPKGVVIPHRGIVRLVRGPHPTGFTRGQRFLLLASTAFDASTFELWAPLLNGATCVIFPDRWPEFDPLEQAVRHGGITHLFLTAGLFNQVIDHRPQLLAGVAHLFTGGEAMSAPHARRLRELFPALRVTNCYGPTEITTYATSHVLAPDETWMDGNVPIGRPAPQTRCYILDTQGELVPVGVPGELAIGGDGIALGYLNLPEATAERFVADEFNPAPGARRYRTGDRCRWRADGVIEFLGRLDDQVKIRGYRIEPGEIDTVLTQHPDVRDAAVVAVAAPDGSPRLVGYVVPRDGRPLDPPALRAFLAERLPDYMVPGTFVTLARLPLNANGKLDRGALPRVAVEDAAPPASARAPFTPTEKIVAAAWQAALGLVPVGTDQNFFALGGHSLLAMQATARLRQALGREIPLRWWFDHPTIGSLAARLDDDAGPVAVGRIEPAARDQGDLPLSHEERRLWFLHHALPDPATYHVVWGARLRGTLDVPRLHAALAQVMARHEILRTGYVALAGQPVRTIAPECPVPLELATLPTDIGASADLVLHRRLAAEVRRPFTLEHPPLWRALCVQIRADDHVVLFTAHHLVCDEWSLPIFHRELAAAYAGESTEAANPSDIQYADYAVWQTREQQRELTPAGRRNRAFWREHLRGAPDALHLPAELPPATVPTGAGRRVFFPLAQESVRALEQSGREEGATPFIVWLAAYFALLARWTGQHDIVIGTPLAHRRRAEVQPLIGFFLNTLPLRLRGTPGMTFRTLVREVRNVVLAALEHADLPLDTIAAAQPHARRSAAGALFNVMFVVLDDTRVDLALPGLTAEAIDLSTGTAKADLTLFIDRRPDGEPRGSFEFSSDILTPSEVEQAIEDLRELLANWEQDADSCAIPHGTPAQEETSVPRVSPPAGRMAPRSAVETELILIWRRVLQREVVGVHDNFFASGGHSLLAMQLSHEIQVHLGQHVPLAQLLAAPTIAGLATLLSASDTRGAAGVSPWRGTGHGIPFFYVPGMQGVEFLPPAVAARLEPDRRVFDALLHPGADGRSRPAPALSTIAAEMVRQIRAAQPRGPYSLGGFCHGGMVAFETARQLEAQGELVVGLVLWDTFPVHRWRRRRPAEMIAAVRAQFTAGTGGRFSRDRLRFTWHRLKLVASLFGRTLRTGLPGAAGRRTARMVNAGMKARAGYVPGPVRARVLLLRSHDERLQVAPLPDRGWSGLLPDGSEVVDLPYWHFHLLREPAVNDLAERTADFLRRVERM